MQGQKGDRILLPAAKVGGATREGEILQVMEGDVGVRYRVQWADGHESLITPGAGAAVVLAAGRPSKPARAAKPTGKKPTRKKPTPKKR